MMRRSGTISVLKTLFFLAIAALVPLIRPALPGNTALFDFVAAGFMGLLWIWLMLRRKIEVRLALPMAIIFFASVIAMFNSQALPINILTLCQEVYLFMFFLTLYNIIETEHDMRILTLAWAVVAAGEGTFLLGELVRHASIRAQGTFDNPNMAASYLGVSLFLICQPFRRLRWYAAFAYVAVVGGGLFATKSLSAVLAATVATCLVTGFYVIRSRDRRKLMLAFGALTIVLAVAVSAPWWLDVHNFLDRLPKSTNERTVIWQTGIDTFLQNPMGTGIGPGGFGTAGFVSGGYWGVGRRISLHSDYLSFLVERGVLGFAGLAIFLVTVATLVVRCARSARTDRELLWACGLATMFLFVLIDAWSHEVMHYRHVWLAFALIATQAKLQRRPLPESAADWVVRPQPARPVFPRELPRPVPRLGPSARPQQD